MLMRLKRVARRMPLSIEYVERPLYRLFAESHWTLNATEHT